MGRTTQRIEALSALREYFESKGEIFSNREYRRAEDTPISVFTIRKLFQSYNRMVTRLKKAYPIVETVQAPSSAQEAMGTVDLKPDNDE